MNDAPRPPRAWLVTGPLGRGLAFAIDFGAALRDLIAWRRGTSTGAVV